MMAFFGAQIYTTIRLMYTVKLYYLIAIAVVCNCGANHHTSVCVCVLLCMFFCSVLSGSPNPRVTAPPGDGTVMTKQLALYYQCRQ